MSDITTNLTSVREQIKAIPKAELHAHLEGSVSHQTLKALSQKNNVNLTAPVELNSGITISPPVELIHGYDCIKNFSDFIGAYLKISQCIKSSDDILFVAREYLQTAQQENVKLAELYFSPTTFLLLGCDTEPLFRGLKLAQESAAKDFDIRLRWIFDVVRNTSKDGMELIDLALHAKSTGVDVCAIGLAGYEKDFPAKPFKNAFRRAKELQFNILAHAGETAGSESMLETLLEIQPSRIGHGLAVTENEKLQTKIRNSNTVIEVCPWSNIVLGICNKQEHPLPKMINANLQIVIGSDDPGIFQKSLVDNYILAHQMGVELKVLTQMARQSLELGCL